MKKHILIVGGMGPQASIYAHKRVIDAAYSHNARHNDEYPRITHLSINVPDFITDTTKREEARRTLLDALRAIDLSTVTSGFIACNTAHMLYEHVAMAAGKDKILSIVEATKAHLHTISQHDQIITGLLATPSTIKASLYQVDILPTDTQTILIEHCIRELISNARASEVAPKIMPIIEHMFERGATHIVLGCTELSMLHEHLNIPALIDPVDIIANIVVQKT